MEFDNGGFSIREYTRKLRSVQVRKCWPFSGDITGDLIHSILPPITVAKFRWWSHELASMLAKSPVAVDDSDSPFRRKAKAKFKPCKKRSIVDICATAPKIQLAAREDEGNDSDVLIGSKRKRTKDHLVQKKIKSKKSKVSGDRIFANKVNKCKEQARGKVDDGICSLGIKESSVVMSLSSNKVGSVSKDHDSVFQIPAILKPKRKVCFVRSPDKSKKPNAPLCEGHVRFSDHSGYISQLMKHIAASLDLCCLEMNRLSLSSSEDLLPVKDKQTKVMSSAVMHFESRQQNMFQPAVSERQLTHARAESDLSCFPGPHFSSQERVKDALDLERKGHVAQPIQSFISTTSESPYRPCSSFSQPASADMQCGTLPYQSPFDPVLVEWMQKPVSYRQRHVEEAIMGFPLNLQGELVEANGEGCRSFDQSGLGTGSSKSAFMESDLLLGNLVDSSSGKKHSTEPALAKDGASLFPVPKEKRHTYFPARLGVDETFSEKALFISDTNDGEYSDRTVHSSVSEANPRSHTINLSQQNGLNQNPNIRNVVSNRDGLCLQNTQATMRLMGKDVSVGSSYSDMVRIGERIIARDASIDYSCLGSHTHQSWLWRRTTLGVSETHTTSTLDKNWNNTLLLNTSKDPFPLFCEPHVSLASQSRTNAVPGSESPPTILNPCYSLASFPLSEKDLNFHGSGLAFSQQQVPSSSNYNNVDTCLLPDVREPSFVLPFSCTDSTTRSQPPWPQASVESSCYGMSFINPAEQLVSFYESKSSSYINVGARNKRLASVEEYPVKNHKIQKLPMQGGLSSAKEFFAGHQIRKSPTKNSKW